MCTEVGNEIQLLSYRFFHFHLIYIFLLSIFLLRLYPRFMSICRLILSVPFGRLLTFKPDGPADCDSHRKSTHYSETQ